jgi:hypothetical protein
MDISEVQPAPAEQPREKFAGNILDSVREGRSR